MKIAEIKQKLHDISDSDRDSLCDFVSEFNTDERAGVVAVVNQAKKRLKAIQAEYVRIEKMYSVEKKYH